MEADDVVEDDEEEEDEEEVINGWVLPVGVPEHGLDGDDGVAVGERFLASRVGGFLVGDDHVVSVVDASSQQVVETLLRGHRIKEDVADVMRGI